MQGNTVVARRIKALLLGVAMLSSAAAISAQNLGSVVAAKQNPLPLYANPDAVAPAGSVAPSNLPWPIKESRNDFFKVSVGGKDVWVDAMDVRADRQSTHRCSAMPGAKDTAGSPGAAGKNC